MSYKRISEIPRAERTYWTPERGGRIWQVIGGVRVKKFSFSPFTAKPRKHYTFYADVEMELEVESPPKSGKKRKHFTLPVWTGTYLEFRSAVLSGEVMEKVASITEISGGGNIVRLEYWRNRGVFLERRVD